MDVGIKGHLIIKKNNEVVLDQDNFILDNMLVQISDILLGAGTGLSIYRLALGDGGHYGDGSRYIPEFSWNAYTNLRGPIVSIPLNTSSSNYVPESLRVVLTLTAEFDPSSVGYTSDIDVSEMALVFGSGSTAYQWNASYLNSVDKLVAYRNFDKITVAVGDTLDISWNIYIGKTL